MTCPRCKALSSLAETRDDSPKVVSLADQFLAFSIASDWNLTCLRIVSKEVDPVATTIGTPSRATDFKELRGDSLGAAYGTH